jgi:lia operon protein LiaG
MQIPGLPCIINHVNKKQMKKMNYIITIIVLLLSSNIGFSQEYKIAVENSKDVKLILNDFPNDIPVEGYSGKEIIITSMDSRFGETPDRAKGLKPVYAKGVDNTGLGLSVEKEGNRITVQCLLPITKSGDYKIKVPENIALKIKTGCERSGKVTVQNMKNEVEINVCHSISLKNVTGPLVLSTISGDISISFSEISKDKPISIASVSGEIDITVPAKTPMDLEMGTVSGNMYSDFDFQANDKQMRRIGGSSINTQLNGGGVNLKLTTVSGNIYLRKG